MGDVGKQVSRDSVRVRVEEIGAAAAAKHYDGQCHELRDALWRDVLEAVAVCHPDSTEIARLALEADAFDYPRWTE